jgi:hypothetical protein
MEATQKQLQKHTTSMGIGMKTNSRHVPKTENILPKLEEVAILMYFRVLMSLRFLFSVLRKNSP